jgi:ATP-dependent Zn protease
LICINDRRRAAALLYRQLSLAGPSRATQDDMTEAAHAYGSRPWYKRPVVWIVFVVLATAVATAGVMETGSRPLTIRYGDFLDQVDAGNIASVTFSGTQINGTLKQPLGQAPANSAAAANRFRSQVPDLGDPSLLPELRKQRVPIAVTSSSAYWWGTSAVLGGLAAILLAKPMLLIVAAAFIAGLVRVVRGGKMEMRSTLAMIPMFRSFADPTADQKEDAASASPQLDQGIVAEGEVTRAPENRSKRAWYLSPLLWLAVTVLAAIAVFGSVEMKNGPATISYGDFLDQLDAGNVASVTIAATQIDGKFKQPVKITTADNAELQTAFRSQAPAFGDPALLPELRQQHVAIDVTASSGWLSWLARLPWPMVLIIAALLIIGLVKFVRGDQATSGSAASRDPMTAMIAGLFGRPSQAARPSVISSREAPPKA